MCIRDRNNNVQLKVIQTKTQKSLKKINFLFAPLIEYRPKNVIRQIHKAYQEKKLIRNENIIDFIKLRQTVRILKEIKPSKSFKNLQSPKTTLYRRQNNQFTSIKKEIQQNQFNDYLSEQKKIKFDCLNKF
eukprot:TRINITY_DN39987_c0_g1_i1.p1 TRINITY_DN39987_c0_g1~~TRINITY_DN39987_c0_g1_i1.p1  ORF type:complete len:142 (+),score=28.73 TRINITY_DN39987_c0_g1_i1:36-428(+)